ncbi:MAG: efflux RND transporter permease subunit, partial [Planctomycetaceae bacterium]|nr:efflux RND transporter permease subunit [Planctomycetaceae bacterium]
DDVKRQGVVTKKKSPSILLCINLVSPNRTYDQLYLSNYATLQVKDAVARVPGVSDVTFLGARDYSLRVWLDPEKLASRNLTAMDVMNSLREQNVQVAAGRLGQPPAPQGVDFQLPLTAQGRLIDEAEFGEIIVKTGSRGELTHLRDIARLELGAKNYDVNSYLDGEPAMTLAVFQLPGANALATADQVKQEMERLKARFPSDVDYRIVYDTTIFIDESVHDVYKTLFEAFILVFIVVLVFLQDWKATILPMIDVPVSLIGTFAVMAIMGFSLNNLTLFGLVLAIGIVVDDAIVVLENVETWMAKGYPAKEATQHAMDEIIGPVIAITLVLSSVFVPTAFLAGISGQFYRQFALTIAISTIISAINAMTMTPSRCVQIFGGQDHAHGSDHKPGEHKKEALPWWGLSAIVGFLLMHFGSSIILSLIGIEPPAGAEHAVVEHGSGHAPPAGNSLHFYAEWGVFAAGAVLGLILNRPLMFLLNGFLRWFNIFFDWLARLYAGIVRIALVLTPVMLIAYAVLLGMTYYGFTTVPVGFIPEQDKGYLVVNVQLPDGASLERTEQVMRRLDEVVRNTEGIKHTISVPGYSILASSNISNNGGMFVILDSFEHRKSRPDLHARRILGKLFRQFAEFQDAIILAFGAPPVDGLGNTAGFKVQIQAREDVGSAALQEAVDNLARIGNQQPELANLFTSFRAAQPQLKIQVDRSKAKTLKVALNDVYGTLQAFLGSAYVNDFTRFGRNWQVTLQADGNFRTMREDIGRLKVRNLLGDMVPLSTLVSLEEITGPAIINRYNMYPSAEITGGTKPGYSSGQAVEIIDRLAAENLPSSFGSEWTELTLQQILASKDLLTKLVFPLGVIFVFLVLASQYESWSLPIAIILIVPMCLFAAITGVRLVGLDNNIFTQIGLVVLIGLAAKNAILIVEFSKQKEDAGEPRVQAIVEACRLRLRPILMTSFAFILGVVPLVRATGAGAEMRFSLGVAVFSGMLGVTAFGLFFTPVFYYVIRNISTRSKSGQRPHAPPLAEVHQPQAILPSAGDP